MPVKSESSDSFKDERDRMVYEIKTKYGLTSSEILSAMLRIPRHEFVEKRYWEIAYSDGPVPLFKGATMSQPYTVAFMTDLLDLATDDKVLEIGTGSGYQAAVLSKLAGEVYSVEIIPELAKRAKSTLSRLGYKNVQVKKGNGNRGWREKSPFDAVLVTAGIEEKIPEKLFEQLKTGGVLVAPIGGGVDKTMIRLTKTKDLKYEDLFDIRKLMEKGIWEEFGTFRFVPFVV